MPAQPFACFAPPVSARTPLRRAITAASLRPEAECVRRLLAQARLPAGLGGAIAATATRLVEALRAMPARSSIEELVREYALSSQEGVALMCLAEALLRIPDTPTRDALIRDKVAGADWPAHLGKGRPLFVNAATWGLMVTGRLVGSHDEEGLTAALTRLLARAGEPVIRRGLDIAVGLMGEQFVCGETIGEALAHARRREGQGFAHSYDMLGEAATTAQDAARYLADYEQAIHAIGAASAGRGVYAGPGISIKLSALHPRYARAQADRVMSELLPALRGLALLARGYDIGLNIDAEEADRLDLSLDLFEQLALDPALGGWNGLGFVVQAYGKRCPCVIDWIVDLARRVQAGEAGRRLMVRLVKGAYWDSEIKRAQVAGLADFPVFTRKVHTDLSYIACARRLLAARDVVFPQFATHNAQTLASLLHLAGPDFQPGDYEFQCLFGMGEPLYEALAGAGQVQRPCRIYAPVGTHETLLAYLVRRLLENGANGSFVHRLHDHGVALADLVRDPVEEAGLIEPTGASHPLVRLPGELFADRRNSAGLDLSNEAELARLGEALRAGALAPWAAAPMVGCVLSSGEAVPVLNPADVRDRVGAVIDACPSDIARAAELAQAAGGPWAALGPSARAAVLEAAALGFEQAMPTLLGLIVREAGKTAPNAVGEVREAVDFLRYYAGQARTALGPQNAPLGVVACISPWNFPLAIFVGQIAAALVAGNTVLAKPAQETPLIAAEAVRMLHAAGVPGDVLHLLPGDGQVGRALVEQGQVAGVMFTGSTQVARSIARQLAERGVPVPFVAETGGQNAMIVDSSALAEQVCADVIASAFDSAGQRCSALRILCLQEDIADRQMAMLRGAMAQLRLGNPDRLATDVGPIISARAQARIAAHIERMRAMGCRVTQGTLPSQAEHGHFIAPTLIEIEAIEQIGGEVFGPVLHVLRYRREGLDRLIRAINATGYGLTFGLHSRIDTVIDRVCGAVQAGNLYINRNVIGAVVGVQPFGGRGLSGTGPKAGGPLYLGRLVAGMPVLALPGQAAPDAAAQALARWLEGQGDATAAVLVRQAARACVLGHQGELAGPVGERNLYALQPCGRVLAVAHSRSGLITQLGAALAAGNRVAVLWQRVVPCDLAQALASRVEWLEDLPETGDFAAVLIEPGLADQAAILRAIAQMEGPIPLVQLGDAQGQYRPDWLVAEQSISINTAAAGGNASLMAQV